MLTRRTWLLIPLVFAGHAVAARAQEVAPPPPPIVPPTCEIATAPPAARWYAGVDVLWLARDYPTDALLAQTVNANASTMFRAVPIPGAPVITLGSVSDTAAQPGLRATVGFRVADRTSVELGYFGLQHWARSASILGRDPPFVNSPFMGSSIIYENKSFDTSMTARYASEIHSAEVNAWRAFDVGNWTGSALGGFRYFNLSEQFSLTGFQTFPNVPEGAPPASQTIREQTRVTADNNLFGAQIGAEVGRAFLNDRVGFGVNGKVGIFANSANQFTTNGAGLVTGGSGTSVLAAGRGRTDVAGLYEGGITTTVRVTSRVTVRAGYQVLFVQGLALAPTQLAQTGTAIRDSFVFVPGSYVPRDFTLPVPATKLPAPGTGSGLDTSGNLLLHGPFVGLGVSY
ncbi:BBP7 family outer membrane beta-barrel protein [Gemmata sp.]|uniref:BBP7 family outer membrane beta-barrel protein n=1 Tax=Gemmata sp. TaxID=1914242 RepID=UPI003F71FDE5